MVLRICIMYDTCLVTDYVRGRQHPQYFIKGGGLSVSRDCVSLKSINHPPPPTTDSSVGGWWRRRRPALYSFFYNNIQIERNIANKHSIAG